MGCMVLSKLFHFYVTQFPPDSEKEMIGPDMEHVPRKMAEIRVV
jgi:hypothetical protein